MFFCLENTEYLNRTTVVDKNLDVRLKDVYVTSKGLVMLLSNWIFSLNILRIYSPILIEIVFNFWELLSNWLYFIEIFVIFILQTENIKSNKPLPLQRYTENFDLGYKESVRVPPGRVSLLQAIDFISKHQNNPAEWTIEKIAEENKIKPDVASMLNIHFSFLFISRWY